MSGKHTIILLQYTSAYNSRSYIDFPTVNAAMDGTPYSLRYFANMLTIACFACSVGEDVRAQAEGVEPQCAAHHL